MAIQRLHIQEFWKPEAARLVLDVRSPAEYAQAHIPRAQNLPLFTNEERRIVGTIYKQESREKAIKMGLELFGPKMRKMVEQAEALAGGEEKRELFVYCWRGGMRSAAVAWLLDLYGFKVFTLAGGYKAFRNHVLESFESDYNFRILGGFTGSGKTEVLQELGRNGHAVIDLEAIASHKGSAFGSYRMPPQPSQEMFENRLSAALLLQAPGSTIWLEDESQRIGNVNIPKTLWETMRRAPVFFLDIPFEQRLQHLVEEYRECDPAWLTGPVQRIAKRLGPLETKNTLAFLEGGSLEEAFRILLHYYDKHYWKGLHNRENLSSLLTKISSDRVDPSNAALLAKHQPV